MAVSVPKRLFKKAVDRNLLKRRIREAYRLNKTDLHELVLRKDLKIILVIQYKHREIAGYQAIEEALLLGLRKLAQKLDAQESN